MVLRNLSSSNDRIDPFGLRGASPEILRNPENRYIRHNNFTEPSHNMYLDNLESFIIQSNICISCFISVGVSIPPKSRRLHKKKPTLFIDAKLMLKKCHIALPVN
jgi:hypothetical protein